MKVQNTQQQNYNINNQISHRGVVDETFRFLATNQAVGANLVDLGSMVIPRSTSDMVKRGPAAGWETLRREIMGTVVDSMIGIFGVTGGLLFMSALNNKFDIKANKIFTDPKTIDILAEHRVEQLKNNKTQKEYLKDALKNLDIYNPTHNNHKDGYIRLSDKTVEEISQLINDSIKQNVEFKDWAGEKKENYLNVVINKITEETGAQSNYVLKSKDGKIECHTNLKSLLKDIYLMTETFNKEKIQKVFEDQIKNNRPIKENIFLKNLQKFLKSRAAMGIAISCLIGMSVQPINIYLTKKKTGSDGFVGVEGRTKDDSAKFKVIKTAGSIGFAAMILKSLNILKTPLKFMDKMSFNGKIPTINQLKGVYGFTIISRIFATRDKDELREVLLKDSLGFVSWLILGDVVNKLVADKINKSVMNYNPLKGGDKANLFKRSFYASLKTRDEVVIETLAKNGISTITEKDGKKVALSYREMMKKAENLAPEIKKNLKKRLRTLNAAQLAGYLVSGVVLGWGIPNLNIYMTNKADKRRKAKLAEQKALQAQA